MLLVRSEIVNLDPLRRGAASVSARAMPERRDFASCMETSMSKIDLRTLFERTLIANSNEPTAGTPRDVALPRKREPVPRPPRVPPPNRALRPRRRS